jgi:hypothetical protein
MKKMLSWLGVAACAASLVFISTGCQSDKASDEPQEEGKKIDKKKAEIKDINKEENEKLKKIATEYIDDILLGMKDGNYKLFSKNLTDELRERITKDKFALMIDKFRKEKGSLQGKQYLGEMGKGYFKIFLWKAQFKLPDDGKKKDKKDDKDMQNDTLVRLILGHVDDKYIVFGFSFQ